MATHIEQGSMREMWFGPLGGGPTYSFREDPTGTTVSSGQAVRSLRLGDPINTGPNDTWHQLSWQGGALQDIWNDAQMYQKGNLDTLSYTGKARLWPGLQSWWKDESTLTCHSMVMAQGARSDTDWRLTTLYAAESDRGPWEVRAPAYALLALTPGYARNDPRALQYVVARPEPFRGIYSVQSDNYAQNWMIVTTATHMYMMSEGSLGTTPTLIEDTNAPATGAQKFEYTNNTGIGYNDGFYYAHGNRLMKRVPAPPYGVLGTHTVVKNFPAYSLLRGMTIYNSRIYFGALYPGGGAAVFVSDGATTVKAFDFPQQFYITRMISVAGSLYVLGMQPAGFGQDVGRTPNVMQQLWRYDGVSLKKIWQEGTFDDGEQHWASDLATWNGWVVWGSQGTGTSANQTGVAKNNYACLMFYDPVNDSIVPGPGLDKASDNVGGLYISSLCQWNGTVAMAFKDQTVYNQYIKAPMMICTMRGDRQVRHDLRWQVNGDAAQVQDPATDVREDYLYTSEYHGTDDVANDRKTWLSVKVRAKMTGTHGKLDVLVKRGIDDNSTFTIASGLTDDGTHDWQDFVIPVKNGNNYITSKKLQVVYRLYNNDFNEPDSTDTVWIDDSAVQYMLAPTKVRQWQVRIPLSDGQLRDDGSANPLSTLSELETELQNLFFGNVPVLFWGPNSGVGTPGYGGTEVIIQNATFNVSRVESTDTAAVGSAALTIVENITNQ